MIIILGFMIGAIRVKGAPFHLNKYMSLYHFEVILKALRYTNIPSPPFRDKFHPIRQMVQ
jgi:hypothetical protein